MNKLIFLLTIVSVFWRCQSKYPGVPESYYTLLDSAFVKAGKNAIELQKALSEVPVEQKEGMAYIISYMPKRDLTNLTAAFLLENSEYAYKAREKYKWCAALPDSIFFNEVLPYANISETRDPWRKDFFERFSKYVDDKDNMVDAIFAIARPINKEVKVEYNTNRSKVDLSPKEAMSENMATCTGLSIILTDESRISCRVDIYKGDEKVDFGYSPRKTDDMNLFLKFRLKKGTKYTAVITNPGEGINQSFQILTGNNESEEFKLVHKN